MSSPLFLQFGSHFVTVSCEDTAVAQTLRHHFKYCTGQKGKPVAHYRISTQDQQWCLSRGQTVLFQSPQAEALLEPFLQDALEQLITPEEKHLIFHGGGVAAAEKGILLCGQTAVGKSTLTAQLVMAGFNYLTDEAVAITLPGTEMCGFARPIVLKPGAEFLWQTQPVSADLLCLPGGFTWLAPTLLRPDCVQATAVPFLVLFPTYKADTDFSARPLTSAEAAFHLMQNLVNARNLPEKGFTAVTQLAQKVTAFALQYGDGTAVAAWLQNQLIQDAGEH